MAFFFRILQVCSVIVCIVFSWNFLLPLPLCQVPRILHAVSGGRGWIVWFWRLIEKGFLLLMVKR